MILFNSDYMEGCHPRILELLQQTNFEQAPGYEQDQFCDRARELIRAKCGQSDLDVHFFSSGTLTNLTVIGAALRPHQAVISTELGHVATHETGAIELTGHKVLPVPSADGKLTAEQVRQLYEAHHGSATAEHEPQPKLVYISHPTELGTLYTRAELQALHETCADCGLYLYMDGARLGYGLAAEGNDLDLPTIAALCDVFYIGGNKVGALIGEALCIRSEALKKDFRYSMKQRGALTAKGRLIGIQFIGLFEDDLYLEISKNAIETAMVIRRTCEEKGYPFLAPSPTNQQFPILPNEHIEALRAHFGFGAIAKVDEGHTAVRFCTSWATRMEDVLALCERL
ncbi:MAG: aminotransferase class I/II-fold pyridoxal phosphate-dependent enzyme [Clostridiales bacterium]|nr:aminotransferase class I/II-fold pyridoxal phosphate-dependent enzyme [Clostridiales bacterium]